MSTARPLLPLNGFRTFEAAARHLSFARAAQELRVTPAAVSHQVRALEDYLGVTLFRRVRRRVFLTETGQVLLPELRDAFDRLEATMARTTRRIDDGVLTVSMSPSFAAKWLVPRLDHFTARHPDIDVRIDASLRLVDFAGEDVDLAIRYGPGGYPGLEATTLFVEELFPVCSPHLLVGDRSLRQPSDLRHHALLHDETPNLAGPFPDWRAWLRAAGAEDVDWRRGLRFSSSIMATQAAVEGQGVLLGRSVIVADDLAAGRLVRPLELSCPLSFAYHLVHPAKALRRRRVRAFREWLITEARGHDPAA